jgi:hypothetical protein
LDSEEAYTSMTVRRRRLWLVALAGLVLAGGVWVWAASRAVWINKAASSITIGMSRERVIEILGRPPHLIENLPFLDERLEAWDAIDGRISITFSHQDAVVDGVIVSENLFAKQLRLLRQKLGF